LFPPLLPHSHPPYIVLQPRSTGLECEGLTTRWYANVFHCRVMQERRVATFVLFLDLVSVCRNRWLAMASRSSAVLPVVPRSSSSLLNININMVTCLCQRAANLT
jgi:hypothetical protein